MKAGRTQRERGGGEAPWTAPTKERKSPSKQRGTGSASSMDMKEGRTRREEGHEGRNHTKGGRTQREGGYEGRKCDRPVPPLSSALGSSPGRPEG